jgi:hypothetical protein
MLRASEGASGSDAIGVVASVAPGQSRGKSSRLRAIGTARQSFNPALPRLGRLMRQCQRCLWVHDGIATSTQLLSYCYPGQPRRHWHHGEVRRALRAIGAKPIGRSPTGVGRPGIWALESYTENPSK